MYWFKLLMIMTMIANMFIFTAALLMGKFLLLNLVSTICCATSFMLASCIERR
jgi:hypothetical protein